MKRTLILCIAVAGGLFAGSLPDGFTPIFNGRNTSGWHISRMNHHGKTGLWTVEDGVLVARQNPIGEGGILLTNKLYKDFELYLEVKPDWSCDGGVFLRSDEEGRAYQIMLDYLMGGSVSGLTGEGISLERSRAAERRADWERAWNRDDWNSLRVRMVGEKPRITVWLNDVQMLDYQDSDNHATARRRAGMLALQMHFSNTTTPRFKAGGAHRFRNIGVKVLEESR